MGMKRLYLLVNECLKYSEPILLVGDTGCGKTTICQIHSAINNSNIPLKIVNLHKNTETSDLLGSLRPNRRSTNSNKDDNIDDIDSTKSSRTGNGGLFEWVDGPLIKTMKNGEYLL